MTTDTDFPLDWNQFRSEFARRFGTEARGVLTSEEQRRFWAGPNFMTPEFVTHTRIDGHPVEVSTGVFLSSRIVGLTFRTGDRDVDIDRSGAVHTWDDLEAALAGHRGCDDHDTYEDTCAECERQRAEREG
jgi:hypothetical protein